MKHGITSSFLLDAGASWVLGLTRGANVDVRWGNFESSGEGQRMKFSMEEGTLVRLGQRSQTESEDLTALV